MRLGEENIKQKEDLLSRNYEKRLEKENEELQSIKDKELFDMQLRLEL